MTAITPPDAHLIEEAEDPTLIRAKIIAETARISWLELQKFYAAGNVISVEPVADLIEVAFAFSQDNKAQVADWLSQGSIRRTTEQQAQQWYQAKTELWAVVISPWILVQDKPLTEQLN
ncbi:DUF2288 domain-containing protein [Rheinheimera sp. UJ51]|uniref:DUF2288 domain-containing protein n=1 Tax=unclassified Rheinheimera TaxID=115860 RepID=UPI001E507BA1|nr:MULTISPECIES: DUF2288 domain-containing protein [unclassified Rheinheimera]MCC5450664.1 DUF2288 domain-containing protein [Rheinheimera sp. UJ51]MCF4008670.1 DUF2288 domain-containing protein [Rheinheimera sp. UJ63]